MTGKWALIRRLLLLTFAGPLIYAPFTYLMDWALFPDWIIPQRAHQGIDFVSPNKKYVAREVVLTFHTNPFFPTQVLAITLRHASILPAYFTETEILKFNMLEQPNALSPNLLWLDNQHLLIKIPKFEFRANQMLFRNFVDNISISIDNQ